MFLQNGREILDCIHSHKIFLRVGLFMWFDACNFNPVHLVYFMFPVGKVKAELILTENVS